MKLNWNFLGGEEVQNKKPSVEGGGNMDIFWNYTLPWQLVSVQTSIISCYSSWMSLCTSTLSWFSECHFEIITLQIEVSFLCIWPCYIDHRFCHNIIKVVVDSFATVHDENCCMVKQHQIFQCAIRTFSWCNSNESISLASQLS